MYQNNTMTDPNFRPSASGLLLPVSEQEIVKFERIPDYSCGDLEDVLCGLQDAVKDEQNPSIVDGISRMHNDMIAGCAAHCKRLNDGCGFSEVNVAISKHPGDLEVVRDRPTEVFMELIALAIVSLDDINDGIMRFTKMGRFGKDMIELALRIGIESGVYKEEDIPEVTNGAYEELIRRSRADEECGPNFNVAKRVFGSLLDASIDQRHNPADPELASRHLVVPSEAGLIRKVDVTALYDHPDPQWKYWLNIANEPKGSFLRQQ